MAAPTRAEPGNMLYDLYRTSTCADSLHLFKIYADQAVLEAHRLADHYKAYRAGITDPSCGAHRGEGVEGS